ncbi:hypothetical protein AAVH_42169 [Aphelenchoides avenae]|nr:hypothetical protein AAVH_42169 [Aphelenchus avenae]
MMFAAHQLRRQFDVALANVDGAGLTLLVATLRPVTRVSQAACMKQIVVSGLNIVIEEPAIVRNAWLKPWLHSM